MYAIIGIILGLLDYIDFGIVGLGEIGLIFILSYYGFFKGYNKNDNKNSNVNCLIILILYLSIYFIFNVNSFYIIKNIFKWIIIMLEIKFSINCLKKNENNYFKLIIPYLTISKLVESISTISIFQYFLHYGAFVFTFVLLFRKKEIRRTEIMIYLSCIFFSFAGHSRISFLLLLSFVLYKMLNSVFRNPRRTFSKKILNVVLVIIIIISALISYKVFSTNISEVTQSNTERKLLLELSINEFKHSPIIGVGPGNFNEYARTEMGVYLRNETLTNHNFFLEILTELGIVGFLIFIFAFMPCIKVLLNPNYKLSTKYLSLYLIVFYFFSPMAGVSRVVFSIFYSIIIFDYERLNENEKSKSINNNSSI